MIGCVSSRPSPGWAETALAILVMTGPALGAPPAAFFRIDGHRPEAAIIAVGETWDATMPLTTPMSRQVAGVLDTYDQGSIGSLLRCVTRDALPPAAQGRRVALIHLMRPAGDVRRRLEIVHLADGTWGARAMDTDQGVVLDARRFGPIVAGWERYRGGFDESAARDFPGSSFALPLPYVAGVITLDPVVQKRRIYRGMPVRTIAPDRILDSETMHVRLPRGYTARRPAGLVVWSSPTQRGAIPGLFGRALDELNLVCIGSDDTGNDRDVPDKFQMVFDAVATARARFHIDGRRIYIVGMSGGAKLASILAMCFPDVFAGAVPIVGFACYSTLDSSWAPHDSAYFAKPSGRLLVLAREHRMALMGGPPDFNFREMTERAARLEADGFGNIRFFSYPDMAHVMPTSGRFVDALEWVDERARLELDAKAAAANAALKVYLGGREQPAPRTAEDRASLTKILRDSPWTDAAWRALELLR